MKRFNPTQWLGLLLGGLIVCGAQSSANAGIFTWSAPVTITAADATLNLSGTIVGAEVFGNDAKLVALSNGTLLDFKADNSVASTTGFGTDYGAFTGDTSNAVFNAVLNQFNYDGGPKTITLNNLVVGQQYSVQLFAVDARGVPFPRTSRIFKTRMMRRTSPSIFKWATMFILGRSAG